MHIREQILEMIAQGVDPQEARNQVFIDTHNYYTQDLNRRCANEGGACFYSPKSVNKEGVSEGCAVGRLLLDEEKNTLDDVRYGGYYNDITKHLGDDSSSMIEYLGDEFLSNLQLYHDRKLNNQLVSDTFMSWVGSYLKLIESEI